jgi:hypothetical protein
VIAHPRGLVTGANFGVAEHSVHKYIELLRLEPDFADALDMVDTFLQTSHCRGDVLFLGDPPAEMVSTLLLLRSLPTNSWEGEWERVVV